ncbi:hypothetical protein [Sphingomonas sp.]|uniref:hypothetical protein n=1 Tax=Sphingomonas sp. TaxID=28214 RepID=UPI001B0CDB3C|nr:hypothetical protein [Sphingomonas sp.]MBO9712773.1 hypothetical protein [Sphingomonas sp.]
MRVFAALAALMLLAGCEVQPAGPNSKDAFADAQTMSGATGPFDYRYAFRLPAQRVKQVQQSNADACDKLGPARCQILAEKYVVGDTNRTRAVLTLKIDPTIARAFGDAAVRTLQSADGQLTDSEVTGAVSNASVRSAAMVDRLRGQLKVSQTQADAGSAEARARAGRIQSALDTIAEVEASQGQTLATATMLVSYESSTALTGLGSPEANFHSAGMTFESTVSRVLIVLASFGPWFLLLVLIVLVLRFVVHGPGGGFETPEQTDEREREEEAARHENRNLIHRWFNRDDERHPEPQHGV